MGKINRLERFKEGFYQGIGWSMGVTVGFILISTIIVLFLSQIRAIPVIGEFIANIVEATQISLAKKSLIVPQ